MQLGKTQFSDKFKSCSQGKKNLLEFCSYRFSKAKKAIFLGLTLNANISKTKATRMILGWFLEIKKHFGHSTRGGPDFQFGVSLARFRGVKIRMLCLSCCERYEIMVEYVSSRGLTFNLKNVKNFIWPFLFTKKSAILCGTQLI